MKDSKKKPDSIKVDYQEKYLRALADYQNLSRRIEQEKGAFVRYTNEDLVLKILPIFDSLEKASQEVKDQGISLIHKQLFAVLLKEGLEKIETLGQDFDPKTMECLELTDGEKNKVVAELRPGYRLKGKIIRVSQVKVGEGK